MLELRGVAKVVEGATHIAPTDLSLAAGTLNVLLGPTLSGKTSLLRLMAGLDKPTAGEIWFDGANVTGVPVRRRNVAMVYQQFVNYPSMSVLENIASPLRVAGLAKAEIEARVSRAAELLQLTPHLKRMPLELSGGQQQRTALARAIVKQAPLVLLDEPLANLDYKLREELREELPRLFAQSGSILIYATTEPAEALMLGGNTATLSLGQVTQFGPTADVFRQPKDLVTAQTFSDPPLNIARVEKRGEVFELGGHAVPAPAVPDGRYTLGVRSHHLRLAETGLDGVVSAAEKTGSESFIHVETGVGAWVLTAPGVVDLAIGAPVKVAVDPSQLLVFDAVGERVAA
ncbi:MAG TPA: ABC transporter ATP-binding protein [Caulobacteraceae bacterium]|nr:ABC transporter ATP-binding protein [Caulobacteraceae bacterium]